jgi:hypothetical protein
MNKKKIILTILGIGLLFGLFGGLYAYKEYNRKNIDIAEAKPSFVMSEMDLIKEFSQDQNTSNKKYLGKLVELSGNIKKIDTDENGFHTIILGSSVNMSSVRCSIDSSFNSEAHGLTVGSKIIIKGICTGYNADDLGLGSDVILNRSITIKK